MRGRVMAAALFAAVACACGGPIDARFDGTWEGTSSFAVNSGEPRLNKTTIVVMVTETAVVLTGVCPDGSGTLGLHGSGDSASWTGEVTCSSVPFTTCASVSPVLKSAWANLAGGGGSILVKLAGTLTGCGSSASFLLSFSGNKQP